MFCGSAVLGWLSSLPNVHSPWLYSYTALFPRKKKNAGTQNPFTWTPVLFVPWQTCYLPVEHLRCQAQFYMVAWGNSINQSECRTCTHSCFVFSTALARTCLKQYRKISGTSQLSRSYSSSKLAESSPFHHNNLRGLWPIYKQGL